MKVSAQVLVAFAPFLLASVFPFFRVVRSGRAWRAFTICWISLVGWMFVFSIIIPLVAGIISRDFGREVALHWVPEGPAVMAAAFTGWFYAGITVLLALLVRRVVEWSRQRGGKPQGAEPGAAPNGGPATPIGNSGVSEGPPSVS